MCVRTKSTTTSRFALEEVNRRQRRKRRSSSKLLRFLCCLLFKIKSGRYFGPVPQLADVTGIRAPSIKKLLTVRDAISCFPDVDDSIPNHRTMTLSPSNQERIERTSGNGGLSKDTDSSFVDSYGRMRWDLPAPTITTKCISFSNGRFGHPVFNRAITVREAAVLQGFPSSFVFNGPLKESARQVGNAAPPPIAKWIGEQILQRVKV